MGQRQSHNSSKARHHSRKMVIKKGADKQLKLSTLGPSGTSSSLAPDVLSLAQMEREEDSVIAAHNVLGSSALVVPRRSHNICGVFLDVLIISAPLDDPMERDLGIYELFNMDEPESKHFALIARPEVSKSHGRESFISHLEVLKNITGNIHLPTIIVAGPIRKLYFGIDNFQQGEHDPEWKARPVMIVHMPSHCIFLASLNKLSPSGTAGTMLALAAGLGLVHALIAMHDKGFINRYVTPWNFMIPVPFSMENLAKRMLIMDLSLAIKWDQQEKNRLAIQFAGTVKYSSVRALLRHNVGPADDFISVIFIVAEMISGKLPWRAVGDIDKCCTIKKNFTNTVEYRRLPRELRHLYGTLYKTYGLKSPDNQQVIDAFEQALKRRVGPDWEMKEVPHWLEMLEI